MATIGNLVVRLTADTTNFEKSMQQAVRRTQSAEAQLRRSGQRMMEAGQALTMGISLPIAAVAAGAAYMAVGFQKSMEMIRTQAGASQAEVDRMSKSVLAMAGTVGQGPTQLANSLFHLESVGQRGAQALTSLRIAAEGAAVGGADVVQTTNALAAAMVSGIRGTETAAKAMGTINAIIGSGNMTMSDFVASMNSGLIPVAKDFGLSLRGVGEMLATLTDNGVPAADAATKLRMSLSLLGAATPKAEKVLNSIGVKGVQLGRDLMQPDGPVVALRDLAAHLAAYSAPERNQLIAQMFGGGKSSASIIALLNQLPRVEQKYKSIMSGSGGFAAAWAATQQTAAFQLQALRSSVESAGVALGTALLPFLLQAVAAVRPLVDAIRRASDMFRRLPAPIQGASVAFLLLVAAIGPAIYGLGFFRKGLAALGESLGYLLGPANLVLLGIAALVAVTVVVATHWQQFVAIARRVWDAVAGAVIYAGSLIVRGVGLIMDALAYLIHGWRGAAQAVTGYADAMAASAGAMWAPAATAHATAAAAKKVAASGHQAAKGQQALADGINAASKAAKNGIQSFDQVHQLQQKGAAALGLPTASLPTLPSLPALPTIGAGAGGIGDSLAKAAATAQKAWAGAGSAIGGTWSHLLASAEKAFPPLKAAIDLADKGVAAIRKNWPTIGPIVRDIASVLSVIMVPALIKTGAEAVAAAAKMIATWVQEGIEAAISVGKTMVQMVILGAKYVWLGIQALAYGAKAVAMWVLQGLKAAANIAIMIAQFVILGAKYVWLGIQAMASAAQMAAAWFVALGPIGWVTAAVIALAALIITHWKWVKQETSRLWGEITGVVSAAWKAVSQAAHAVWQSLTQWLSATWTGVEKAAGKRWNAITGAITGAYDAAKKHLLDGWNWLADKLGGIWQGIKDTAKAVWGDITRGIKGFLNAIIGGINAVIRALDTIHVTVPRWVPIYGGRTFGIDIPQVPLIPMAAGGVVNAPTPILAGEAGPEAIVPLGRSGFTDAIGRAVYEAVRDATRISTLAPGSGTGNRSQEVTLAIDGRRFARLIYPHLLHEAQRLGTSVIRVQGGTA